jgi:hypothetical protein
MDDVGLRLPVVSKNNDPTSAIGSNDRVGMIKTGFNRYSTPCFISIRAVIAVLLWEGFVLASYLALREMIYYY